MITAFFCLFIIHVGVAIIAAVCAIAASFSSDEDAFKAVRICWPVSFISAGYAWLFIMALKAIIP